MRNDRGEVSAPQRLQIAVRRAASRTPASVLLMAFIIALLVGNVMWSGVAAIHQKAVDARQDRTQVELICEATRAQAEQILSLIDFATEPSQTDPAKVTDQELASSIIEANQRRADFREFAHKNVVTPPCNTGNP